LVKCWYQANLNLNRKSTDKKRLTPELLLHDADLVRVDYAHQVNLIRDVTNLQDAANESWGLDNVSVVGGGTQLGAPVPNNFKS